MKTRLTKMLVLLAVIAALVATMAMPALATGETVSVTGVEGVSVSVDSNGTAAESSGTVTVTAKGSFTSAKTATVTVKNTSGSTATISFDYSGTNVGSCSLGSVSSNKISGTKSVLLTADETTTFTIKSRTLTSSTTATISLSNFKVEAVAASSNVTVTYGSLGSVTIDGTTVASGSVNSVSSASGASFVAVPGSGSKFVGWIDPATNAVLSTSATYQLIPTEAMSIRAVFANASAAPCFWASSKAYLFEDLNTAVTYAASAPDKTIVLASDATLPAGDYTIPAGVTLLIPYDAANTLCTTAPFYGTPKTTLGITTYEVISYTTPSVYRTLTMADGANITVNGAISLSGQVSAQYAYNGMPTGPLPFIKMNSGSSISVENGANLYAWGYITGSGSVEVKSGGTVYECFQITDYRGGDVTSNMASDENKAKEVFPFNQYYVQNVEVPMTLHAGAKEKGFAAVNVTLAGVQTSSVPFIDSEGSMFIIDSGYVVKDYVENTGRLEIQINGDVSVSAISMSMKVTTTETMDINSADYALPIAQHMTVSVESGKITMNQSIAFLPGSELYIKEDAQCILGADQKIIVYDLDQWLYNNGANGYSGTTNLPYMALKYVPGGNGTTGRLKDALIQIDGTVDASAGAIYCTSGGANIYSTGTGKITLTPGTETVTYQVITADTDISSWPEIALIPAVLTDADGATVSADVAGDYIYYASTGKWCTPSHRYDDGVVTAPTCTADGYTTHTCVACLDSYNDTEVAATGHSYESVVTAPSCTESGYTTHTCSVCGHSYQDSEVDALEHTVETLPEVAATCTETGLTEGKHCSVCGEVQEAQEEIPALGHTEVVDAAVAATCTETGWTEGKHCSACGEVLVAQVETSALGHTEVIDAAVAATCTATGLTEGKHCSVCGEVILAQEETPALGHKEVTDAAVAATCTATGLTEGKHCSVCGEKTVPQEVVAAKGHTEVTDAAVAATCTTTGLTEGKHCSVCNEVLVAQAEVGALGHSWSDWVVTEPTYKEAGQKTRTCSACGETETEAIDILEDPVSAWGISLHDNIGVRFELNLAEGDTVVITVNGVNADVVKDENGYYCVYVAAAQMTDEIAITVNGLPLADTYSVRGYADIIISGDYDNATKNLVKYMLVYGGAAQTYFGYNNAAENLASNGITVTNTAISEAVVNEQKVTGKISGVKFYGASLVYRNKIAVRFYFTGDVSDLTFTVNGEEYRAVAKEDMSYVEIANILPQDLDAQITLTATDDSGNTLTVTYGPMNYIVRMNDKGSENLPALVLAMYNYHLAAEAYSIDN